jgi:hypothetical protein
MATLCPRVNRKMLPSSPTMPLAAVATEMDCGEIILPQTPPEELAATVRAGGKALCTDWGCRWGPAASVRGAMEGESVVPREKRSDMRFSRTGGSGQAIHWYYQQQLFLIYQKLFGNVKPKIFVPFAPNILICR